MEYLQWTDSSCVLFGSVAAVIAGLIATALLLGTILAEELRLKLNEKRMMR